ncbi:MAG: trehalose-phosphatase [Gemmatimonadales bacterium]
MSLTLASPAGRRALARLAAAPAPVLFLDVDGTLAPIVPVPSRARVPAATRRLLDRLQRSGARVVLVSGRSAHSARRVAGGSYDGIIGNHGAELLRGRRSVTWCGVEKARIRRLARHLSVYLRRHWPGTRVEDKGYSIAVHHRLVPAEVGALLAALRREIRDRGISALPGRQVIDIRAREAHKGAAVLRWLDRVERGRVPRPEVLYAGDDTTDEDAFRALGRSAVTVAVGHRPRHARFRTPGPVAFGQWLEKLAAARGGK